VDPNATWERMLEAAKAIFGDEDATDSEYELAMMITFLKEWLDKGGFAPDDFRGRMEK
jgi:hypothetical protein